MNPKSSNKRWFSAAREDLSTVSINLIDHRICFFAVPNVFMPSLQTRGCDVFGIDCCRFLCREGLSEGR